MRNLISAMLIVVAVIHLMPLSGVLGSERLSALYGIRLDEPNLAILMRHRAVLFGLLGVFLLYAASRPAFQLAAFIAGFVCILAPRGLTGRCTRPSTPGPARTRLRPSDRKHAALPK